MTLQHRAERIVDQRPDIVHDRLLELAARLRDELPPIEPGTELQFGYNAYYADPDGHPWEVCYNPSFPIGPDGRITIP